MCSITVQFFFLNLIRKKFNLQAINLLNNIIIPTYIKYPRPFVKSLIFRYYKRI